MVVHLAAAGAVLANKLEQNRLSASLNFGDRSRKICMPLQGTHDLEYIINIGENNWAACFVDIYFAAIMLISFEY